MSNRRNFETLANLAVTTSHFAHGPVTMPYYGKKLKEEVRELLAEINRTPDVVLARVDDELGDVLMVIVKICKFYNSDPYDLLFKATNKAFMRIQNPDWGREMKAVENDNPNTAIMPGDYPGKAYQPLFDYMLAEHDVTLLDGDIHEIINIVLSIQGNGPGKSAGCEIADLYASINKYADQQIKGPHTKILPLWYPLLKQFGSGQTENIDVESELFNAILADGYIKGNPEEGYYITDTGCGALDLLERLERDDAQKRDPLNKTGIFGNFDPAKAMQGFINAIEDLTKQYPGLRENVNASQNADFLSDKYTPISSENLEKMRLIIERHRKNADAGHDAGPYITGVANGLIYAAAIMTGHSPNFIGGKQSKNFKELANGLLPGEKPEPDAVKTGIPTYYALLSDIEKSKLKGIAVNQNDELIKTLLEKNLIHTVNSQGITWAIINVAGICDLQAIEDAHGLNKKPTGNKIALKPAPKHNTHELTSASQISEDTPAGRLFLLAIDKLKTTIYRSYTDDEILKVLNEGAAHRYKSH